MTETMSPSSESGGFHPGAVKRPDEALLRYYLIISLFGLFLFPLIFLSYCIRYRTLWYSFDDEGVRMGWGLFWKREINLTYRRIQDIHVTRNIIERRMGLAKVAVQTASGSSTAEATFEGILDPEGLRDFLYHKMRGARGERTPSVDATPAAPGDDEALQALRDIAASLRTLVEKQERAQ
jgi:putative membrane protein